jgi:thiamine thiazole synthase
MFHPVSESEVSSALIQSFYPELLEDTQSDVVIVGGGPSGLMAGRELAQEGYKAVIVERNNYLGGGFWVGGYFMNRIAISAPAYKILQDLGVPLKEARSGLYTALAPSACSKLISACCDSGVKFLSLTLVEDVILKEGKVGGVVVNWSPIDYLPREVACLDPIPLESKIVIDATGHDACVANKLEARGLVHLEGEGALWIARSEDLVVEKTSEIYPGLIVCGMTVAQVFGLPRMGPIFGGMLLSGKKAGEIASQILRENL